MSSRPGASAESPAFKAGGSRCLARYRMCVVVTEIDGGYAGTFTELSHRYGWYDQAHFTRDLTTVVGVTPAQYHDRRGRTADFAP